MLKATLKSLLGRKLRLLMSTFAIVLGVAFVGGSLIFSDTLGRSFTALFASTVGDVVVRPADGSTERRAVVRGDPCLGGRRPGERAGRGPGRRQRHGVRRLRRRQGQQGRRRPGSAGDRRQLLRRARRPRAAGSRPDRRAGRRSGPDEVVFDAKTAAAVGLLHRREGAHRHRLRPGAADARSWSASSTSPRAARSTARRSPRSTPRPRRTCSSRARTPSPTSG